MMRASLVIAVLTQLTAVAAPPDSFDRAASALAAGLNAEADANRPALRAAARALVASGAAPVDGQADAASRWQREAKAEVGPASRNRALGPGYRLLVLDAGATAAFEQTFLAGQRARVAVAAGPAAVFALSVAGEGAAAPVCPAVLARARCDWVPLYTERFRIELANRGARAGRFFLVVE